MIEFLFINQIFLLLINILGIWLIFWVYLANPKAKSNQWFSVMTFFVLLWTIFAYLGSSSHESSAAILWYRLNWGAVSLSAIAAYFFTIYFPQEKKRYPILDKIVPSAWIILCLISVFTNLIIKDVEFKEWGSEIIFGSGENIFLIASAVLLFLIISQLSKKYLGLPVLEKLKVKYFLIGISLFALFNFIFNIIFPAVFETVKYQHFGDYSTIFLLGFTAYAIVKHKLFDIKIILTTALVGLIAILLTLDTLLFTTNFSIQVLKGASLFLFLFFGYYLIKSVKEEVKSREEAEILSRAKSEFISMASHQLRTPLTVIKGYIAMILDGSYGKIGSKTIKILDNVSISTERLVKIIEDLLNISRIELGKMDLEKKPTDIKKMIDNICQEIKIKAQEKNLELVWEKPKSQLPKLNIDELKIRQVVYNIVDNAIKYTNTGKVEIKLERKKSNLAINISDTGRGFTKEDNIKLFELFGRGEAGTDTFVEGTGMGLFVAKKFVNLHHGKIWADSKGKNKGSVFHIELPIK